MKRGGGTRDLVVWMNGERVGRWTLRRGEHEFAYDAGWIASERARPISLSMPLRPGNEPYRTKVVLPFFDNLLPDSADLRQRLAARFGLATGDAFDLLGAVGRDCVGAVQLLPADVEPQDVRQTRGDPLTEAQVAKRLVAARSTGWADFDKEDFRISLAGAQEKTALLRGKKAWMLPRGSTPTTHIFKLARLRDADVLDMSTSVENEWLCAQLLPELGVTCARCEIQTFKDQKALVVERFDRVRSSDDKWIIRLPQEDLCQATATAPGQKYESEGGPGILAVNDLLRGARDSIQAREDFFRTQFVFWLLCAIDGHAKNFSIFIHPRGEFSLTPRYDVLSAYPVIGRKQHQLPEKKIKMAMAVHGKNRHYRWREIHVSHWIETAKRCQLGQAGGQIVDETLERVPGALAAVEARLPRRFPEELARQIMNGLQTASDNAGKALALLRKGSKSN